MPKFARIGFIVLALCIGAVLVWFRIQHLDDRRDAAQDHAHALFADALAAGPDARNAALDRAETAVLEATRESATLLDPYPAFVLSVIEDVRAVEPEIPDQNASEKASTVRQRIAITLAQKDLAEAQKIVDDSAKAGMPPERAALYRRLIDALQSL